MKKKKTKHISIRLTNQQYEKLIEVLKKEKLNKSQFAEETCYILLSIMEIGSILDSVLAVDPAVTASTRIGIGNV